MSIAPISVVIPCYRCAGTVRRAVASVASQTVRPLELILVEDDSQDDTLPTLRALEFELRPWARVIALEENVGAGAARNAGWDVAQGEYVAFLDADDSWLPEKIESQFAFMSAHPEFQITGHRARYGCGRDKSSGEFTVITPLRVLLHNPMVTPSLMTKRDLALRFPSTGRHMEDHRFLQEAVFSGVGVARMEAVLGVIHKPAFGATGLSADLWAMERAELANYAALRRAGRIGALPHVLLGMYSFSKFCRRVAIVGSRRLKRSAS